MLSSSPASNQLTSSENYFGFIARPFSLTPDLRFAYHSRSHAKALEQVTEALRRRRASSSSPVKSAPARRCCAARCSARLNRARSLSVILDPCLTVDDLLHRVLVDFGLIGRPAECRGRDRRVTAPAGDDAAASFWRSLIPLGAHAVIMIDEAQHLSPTVLEEIRLLSNFETDDAKLLQIVLVGQPDLEQVLQRPDMSQLAQRIARRCELHALSDSEVQDYIERRIQVASEAPPRRQEDPPPHWSAIYGATDRVHFTPAAFRTVADISHGIPRLVNTLCDRTLEVGFEQQTRSIDRPAVLAAADRLKLPVPKTLPSRVRRA